MSMEPKPVSATPPQVVAKCLNCGARFAPGSTLMESEAGLMHEFMNLETRRKELCGPIVNRWTYHVVGFVMLPTGGLGAVDITVAIPVPVDSAQAKGFLRMMLAREWKRRHPPEVGIFLIGSDPEVSIIGWELLSCDFRQGETERACRTCGCTDDAPCEGGCGWVEPDLCSSCAIGEHAP